MTEEMTPMLPPTNGATDEKQTVRVSVKFEQGRMDDNITLDEFIAATEGNASSVKIMLVLFLIDVDTGRYMDRDTASMIVGRMTMKQVRILFEELQEDMGETAVPKEYEVVRKSG
jgi:hypothetical protein